MAAAYVDDNSRQRVGYLFHSVTEDDLQPGDHIYAYRNFELNRHTEIYTGEEEEEVIHFSAGEQESKRSASIRALTVEEFLQGSTLRLVAYGVDPCTEGFKRSGSVHTMKSRPAEEVIATAKYYHGCTQLVNQLLPGNSHYSEVEWSCGSHTRVHVTFFPGNANPLYNLQPGLAAAIIPAIGSMHIWCPPRIPGRTAGAPSQSGLRFQWTSTRPPWLLACSCPDSHLWEEYVCVCVCVCVCAGGHCHITVAV